MNYFPLIIMLIFYVMAVVIKLVNKINLAKILSLATFALCSVLSVACLANVLSTGQALSMSMLEAAYPINIVIRMGVIETLIMSLFCIIGFLIIWSSTSMIAFEVEKRKITLYYAMSTALVGTICGVVMFDNVINTYVFMEASTFIAAAITMIIDSPDNRRAGIRYISWSIMGSAFVLMGLVMIYGMTGSYTMLEIRETLPNVIAGKEWSLFFAMCFITVGGAFKAALFPFHIWSPNTYTYAPAPASAMLSGLVSKPYIIFYFNVIYRMIGPDIMKNTYPMQFIMYAIIFFGVGGMLYGSIMAIIQHDIKRMIAYSSVAQIGYIFMGIGLGTPLGCVAAIYHIITHMVTKAMLFLVSGYTIHATGNRRISNMEGIGIEMPITMAMYTIGTLSMVGVPLFMGFVSKYNFALGIMQSSSNWWVMIVLVLSGLLNIIYYMPIAIRGYFGNTAQTFLDQGKAFKLERPVMTILPIILLGLATIFFGLMSGGILDVISKGITFF